MPQVKREQTEQDDKYLREIAAQYLRLTIEDLAIVLTHPVTEGDAMRAAHLVPELMERVYDAIDAMPSPLTPKEEAEAIQSGARIAERLLAKAHSAGVADSIQPPIPMDSKSSSLAKDLVNKVFRLVVEPWEPGPAVAIASGAKAADHITKLSVKATALSVLGLQPYLRISLDDSTDQPKVKVQLQRVQDSGRPGRYVEPKRRKIQLSLIRPSETISLELGVASFEGPFRESATKTLKQYSPGEERQWQVELRVL